jgi:putative ABC transport system substrate-binding protein
MSADLCREIAYARLESIGGMTGNGAAQVHNACRWSGCCLTALCQRPEAGNAGHWGSRERICNIRDKHFGRIPRRAERIWFRRRPERHDRISEGGSTYDRLPALAADLVSRHVAVIVASGATVSPLAAQAATKIIPIVFFMGTDPVQTGLVASLNRPGGNITGATTFGSELYAKQLGMLLELVPKARAVAMLVNPSNPTHAGGKPRWKSLADSIGLPIESVSASTESDFEPAIASLAKMQVDALNVIPDTLFGSYQENLVAVLARHGMPAMFPTRESVVAGGLISYGGSYASALRQIGSYVGRILKGEKPADLPVLQPTRFDLVINLRPRRRLASRCPTRFWHRQPRSLNDVAWRPDVKSPARFPL